jgi:hypothetical protein
MNDSLKVREIYDVIDSNKDDICASSKILGIPEIRVRFYVDMRNNNLHRYIMDANDNTATQILMGFRSNAPRLERGTQISVDLSSFRDYLEGINMTPKILAERIDLTSTHVSRLLNGKSRFTERIEKKCLIALGSKFETLEELLEFRK